MEQFMAILLRQRKKLNIKLSHFKLPSEYGKLENIEENALVAFQVFSIEYFIYISKLVFQSFLEENNEFINTKDFEQILSKPTGEELSPEEIKMV